MFNPKRDATQYLIKDRNKLSLVKRIIEKEKRGMEPIHPIAFYHGAEGNKIYYSTMRWKRNGD